MSDTQPRSEKSVLVHDQGDWQEHGGQHVLAKEKGRDSTLQEGSHDGVGLLESVVEEHDGDQAVDERQHE